MAIVLKTEEHEKSSELQEKQQEPVSTATQRKLLLCWFHDTDIELVRALDPYLALLAEVTGTRLHYFGYATEPLGPTKEEREASDSWGIRIRERKEKELQTYREKYDDAIQAFEQAAIFLPYISPAFLRVLVRDTTLKAKLASPTWLSSPILLHPTAEFKAKRIRPLIAYSGYEREEACAAIAAGIEMMLRKRQHIRGNQIAQLLGGSMKRCWF